jgi:hypothetical protein
MGARRKNTDPAEMRWLEFKREVEAGGKKAETEVRGRRKKLDAIIARHGYGPEELPRIAGAAGVTGRVEETIARHREVFEELAKELGTQLGPRKGDR